MATRNTHGKARTETPRLRDLHIVPTARDPSEGRTADGRFSAGNRHAHRQGAKALIRRQVGDPSTSIGKERLKLYGAILRSLPSDSPAVRSLVAAQARHAVTAAHLSAEADRVGIATDEGLKLAEAARAHDGSAQRHGVAAYDLAVRSQKVKPADPLGRWRKPEASKPEEGK